MAAATALTRSRGMAGVTTTKGLFLICTLLCLLGLTSSLTHTLSVQTDISENIQKLQEETEQQKAGQMLGAYISDIIGAAVELMDAALEKVEKTLQESSPPLKLTKTLKAYLEECKTYLDQERRDAAAKIEDNDHEVKILTFMQPYFKESEAEL